MKWDATWFELMVWDEGCGVQDMQGSDLELFIHRGSVESPSVSDFIYTSIAM